MATANTYKTYLDGNALATYTGGGVWAQMYVTRSSTTTETTFELWGYAYFKWIDGWTNVDMTLSGTGQTAKTGEGSMAGYGNSEGRSPTRSLYAKWSYSRGTSDATKTFSMSITLSGGYGTSTVSMDCTVPKLEYTACGAPTSVTISSSLAKPSTDVTLSWSGATAGTSNAITGYNVYRSTSETGTYTKLNSSKITTTSFTVTSHATRGSSYYYKVQTIGTVSNYDSGQSSKYAFVKSNSLPSAPTVTVNKTIVPSAGGSVTFTVTAGATNDTGQTASLYYAVGSGTKTSFTSPLTLTVSATTTYNFYTYDGLEYSSATAKAITKNTAPAISTFSGTNTTYTANGASTWVKSISSSFTLSKSSGTLSCDLYYSTTSSGTYTKINVFNGVSITSTSYTRTLNINDILKSIYSQQRLYYYLEAVFNDGVENSATKRYPSSGTYSLSPPPTLNNKYNQFNTSNISGTTSGHFYNKIRQYFNYDSDISACTVSAKYKSSGTSITCTSSLTNGSETNGAYIDITLPNNITGDSIVSFTLSFSNGSFDKTATFEATQVKSINFGNVQQSGVNPIKVYTSTNVYTIVSQWPFGTSDLAAAKTTYEFSADPVVQIFYENNKINLTYTSFEKVGSDLVITLDATTVSGNILSGFTTLFGSSSTKSGIKECSYKLSWTNLYSKVFTSSAVPINISFEEDPTFTTVYPQYSLNGSSSWTALTSSSYLQEGLYIRPRITINYFTEETITGQFMYSIDGGTTFSRWSDISQDVTGTTTRTRGSVTVTGASKQLPEITSTSNWVFKVVLNKNGVSSGNVTCKAIKHISANIEITSLTYNSSGQTITAAINVRDIGYASSLGSADSGTGTAPKVINSGTSSAFVNLSGTTLANTSTVIQYNTTSCTGSYNMGSTASISLQIKYTSQIQGYTTTTKSSYSTIAVLYNMMPTVAYRKNQLGINTTAVVNDSVLDIYSATGKNKIVLHFTQKNGTISLGDGTLTNFIVGGGTWTNATTTSTTNQLVIKKGPTIPSAGTTGNLISYEIGYATNNQTLYINDNGTIRPIGNSSIAQMALTGSYTLDEATIGNLVVTGNASFTNNLQANTINGKKPAEILFGTSAPSKTENVLWIDTTSSMYIPKVYYSSAWHPLGAVFS